MIEQASATGVLGTIATLLAIYYIAKFVMRLAAPYLMKFAAKKMQQKMNEQFGGRQNPSTQQETQPKKEMPKEKKKVGDYIDFEEIDE